MGGPEVEHLISLLAALPGFGPRSARRPALRLLQQPQSRMMPLASALNAAARAVQTCETCGNLDSVSPCRICSDTDRDRTIICVVESVADLWALERARVHRGVYQVLGGTLSALAGVGPDDLAIGSLIARVDRGGVEEVIIALSATIEGATTAHWLTERLAGFGISITRVGQGVPIGGALELLDEGTLAAALRTRRPG